MSFEIIEEGMYAVPNAGYKLDFSHGYYEHNEDYYNGRKTAPSDDVDSFYDDDVDSFYELAGAALCKGEDGNLYAVEYKIVWDDNYNCHNVPAIWQRVCKA